MPIIQLETDYAAKTLMKKLTESGLRVLSGEAKQAYQVEWDVDQLHALADTLATFVFVDWCYEYIFRRVGCLHDYLTEDEREYIALMTFHSIRKVEHDIAGRSHEEWNAYITEAITEMLTNSIRSHSTSPQQEAVNCLYVHVDSLVRFRAKEYMAQIETGIQELVEQFLADREYEEFVTMLRYMLDTQPASQQVLHVFCTNDRVWISDASGELVRDPSVSEAARQVSNGEEVNAEDLTMSILITRAPGQIVIHDLTVAAPWPSFAETVEKVFLGRATRCGECSTCRHLRQTQDFGTRGVHRNAIPDKYE